MEGIIMMVWFFAGMFSQMGLWLAFSLLLCDSAPQNHHPTALHCMWRRGTSKGHYHTPPHHHTHSLPPTTPHTLTSPPPHTHTLTHLHNSPHTHTHTHSLTHLHNSPHTPTHRHTKLPK